MYSIRSSQLATQCHHPPTTNTPLYVRNTLLRRSRWHAGLSLSQPRLVHSVHRDVRVWFWQSQQQHREAIIQELESQLEEAEEKAESAAKNASLVLKVAAITTAAILAWYFWGQRTFLGTMQDGNDVPWPAVFWLAALWMWAGDTTGKAVNLQSYVNELADSIQLLKGN